MLMLKNLFSMVMASIFKHSLLNLSLVVLYVHLIVCSYLKISCLHSEYFVVGFGHGQLSCNVRWQSTTSK